MSKYFNLPNFILLSAILVSASAGFYSVYGLSKLFSGASIPVIIMAGSLELSKLFVAASIHRYWDKLSRLLKVYLPFALVVLIAITSSGIYGFLSDAYQQTADKDKITSRRIELVKTKKNRFEVQRGEYKTEKEQIIGSISALRTSLSTDNQYQKIDRRTGQVLTQIQSTSKKGVQYQLNISTAQIEQLTDKIEKLDDSIATYEIKIIDLESNETSSELGPLKYLANLTGSPMDNVVNWFLILLIIVFDPLAIALVLTWLYIKRAAVTPVEEISVENKPKRKYTRKPKISILSDSEVQVEPTVDPVEIVAPEPEKKVRKTRSRKVVDTNLTADIATHLEQSLKDKKKV